MQLHFQTDESEQPVTVVLTSNNFHRPGSTLEFLVQAFDGIGGSARNPLIFRKFQVCPAGFQRASETFDGRREVLLSLFFKVSEKLASLLFG
jgi:hypothetical protein